jgi:RNA polymerase sigma-70 factor, ECF subfamily
MRPIGLDSSEDGTMTLTKEDRFEDLFRRNYDGLSRFVLFKVHSVSDAEDIVSNVFMNFYKHTVKKNRWVDSEEAYLVEMAKNEIKRYYRNRIQAPISLNDGEWDGLENIADEHDAVASMFDRMTIDRIWQAVSQLDETAKMILTAKFRLDMTFKDIAIELNSNENSVKTKYYRSIEALRHLLKEEL